MIDGITNSDAIPVLEQLMRFSGARHRLVAQNIANLSTPGYRPLDLSVDGFRAELRDAVDERRDRFGSRGGPLGGALAASGEEPAEAFEATPIGANLLFHDQNDRDLEHTMQDLVENFMAFRTAAQFMRGRFDLLNAAISERI